MDPIKIGSGQELEASIQRRIVEFLTLRGWFVMETHGNMYQKGFPDLWASHSKYGSRWIEVKRPIGYSFTAAQLECFPKMCAYGSGVWVMNDACEDQYKCLFKPHNWYFHLLALGQKGCNNR